MENLKDKLRVQMERVGLEPLIVDRIFRIKYDPYRVVRLSDQAILGVETAITDLEKEIAELLVLAHAYILEQYKAGELGGKPEINDGDLWWVESKITEPKTHTKLIKGNRYLVEVHKTKDSKQKYGQFMLKLLELRRLSNSKHFIFIKKVERMNNDTQS